MTVGVFSRRRKLGMKFKVLQGSHPSHYFVDTCMGASNCAMQMCAWTTSSKARQSPSDLPPHLIARPREPSVIQGRSRRRAFLSSLAFVSGYIRISVSHFVPNIPELSIALLVVATEPSVQPCS